MPKLNRVAFGLAVVCVLAGGEAALGQTLTLTPGVYVVPGAGGVGTFPGSGTYKMGAGTTYLKITGNLQQKLPGGAWQDVGGIPTATRTGVTGGDYSITFSWDLVAGAEYRMRTTLFKTPNTPVANAPVGGGWTPVPVAGGVE